VDSDSSAFTGSGADLERADSALVTTAGVEVATDSSSAGLGLEKRRLKNGRRKTEEGMGWNEKFSVEMGPALGFATPSLAQPIRDFKTGLKSFEFPCTRSFLASSFPKYF